MELDVTGENVANKVLKNVVIQNSNESFIFYEGCFYLHSLKLSIQETVGASGGFEVGAQLRPLVCWKDYLPIIMFDQAVIALGRPIYAGFRLINPNLRGTLFSEAQLIGGDYAKTPAEINAALASVDDLLTASYYPTFAKNAEFPSDLEIPISTSQQVNSTQLGDKMMLFRGTLATTPTERSIINFDRHISDTNNPHKLKASQVNLGNVPNWGMATTSQVTSASGTPGFVTPALAALAVGTKANVPEATSSEEGTFRLNLGTVPSDAQDNSRAMTAVAISNLMSMSASNDIKLLFDINRWQISVTPFPISYPFRVLGTLCKNWGDFEEAVLQLLGISGLQFSAKRGCFWIPHDIVFTSPSQPTDTVVLTKQ